MNVDTIFLGAWARNGSPLHHVVHPKTQKTNNYHLKKSNIFSHTNTALDTDTVMSIWTIDIIRSIHTIGIHLVANDS